MEVRLRKDSLYCDMLGGLLGHTQFFCVEETKEGIEIPFSEYSIFIKREYLCAFDIKED